MKILHFSDIHAQGQSLDEVKKCCCFIVDQARKEYPDLIVFAGDAFESSEVRLDSAPVKFIFWLFSELACVAPVVAIAGTPSHDGKATEVLAHINATFPLYVVSNGPEQLSLEDGLIGEGISSRPEAIISCVPAPTKRWFKTDSDIQKGETEIAQALSKIFAGFGAVAQEHACPHILLGHFDVAGSFVTGTQTLTGVDVQVSKDQIGLANADLVCLGHIHLRQQIGENIFFPGGIANHTWGEQGKKGFYIHELKRG